MECGMERRFHRGFTAAEKTELWDRAGIDACGTRGDFQRCYGTSIGPVDRQTAWPLTLDGEPGNESQWRL